MRVEGTNLIGASQQVTWEYLQDPDVLRRVIPGCQEYRKIEEDKYEGIVKLGIGPVRGTFDVKLGVANNVAPDSCELNIEGKGPGGFVKVRAPLVLKAVSADQTEIQWIGEGEVGGPMAAAGNRILVGVAKTLLKQFFASIEAQIMADREETSPPEAKSTLWARIRNKVS